VASTSTKHSNSNNNLISKATLTPRLTLYRIVFQWGAKKHLSNTECITFRSWAKQHLSVAIIPLKMAFILKGTEGIFRVATESYLVQCKRNLKVFVLCYISLYFSSIHLVQCKRNLKVSILCYISLYFSSIHLVQCKRNLKVFVLCYISLYFSSIHLVQCKRNLKVFILCYISLYFSSIHLVQCKRNLKVSILCYISCILLLYTSGTV
jgi:hypothetical protein